MERSDAQLVTNSLAGDRDAFGQIVARYQTLVCSLAYSRTGSVMQSQDLAQETFITAWRELRKLRDPGKLKSWLCTIARNITHDSIKEELREPSHRAESLEDIQESREATELPPPELAINKEEQAILWRAIERVPELYREPLILFYREHRSIEAVAESLELTEDAVKQRLSRGRKLLHEQVLAFVEGALERTNPGKTFTLAVIASLPALGLSANAAAITVATAKSGSALKTAGAAGLLGALATPLVVLLGNMLPYRMAMAEARSAEERHSIRSVFLKVLGISVSATVLSVGLFWSLYAGKYAGSPSLGQIAGSGFIGLVVFYLLTLFGALIVTLPRRRAYYRRVLVENYAGDFPPAAFEFRTAASFLGLPLVHIRIGDRFSILRPPVKAWIAIGDCAFGGLFAFGGVAVAPFGIGGLVFGLVPFGGLVAGLFPIGALALGICSLGGIAIGWQAAGAVAIAWDAAVANISFAHSFGLGDIVTAAQANTESARSVISHGVFFQIVDAVNRHYFWVNLLWIVPLLVQWQLITRRRSQRLQGFEAKASSADF